MPLVEKNKGHPAVYPTDLPLFFIKLLSRKGIWVIDLFSGSGTTGIAALSTGRKCILIDSYENYCKPAKKELAKKIAKLDDSKNKE